MYGLKEQAYVFVRRLRTLSQRNTQRPTSSTAALWFRSPVAFLPWICHRQQMKGLDVRTAQTQQHKYTIPLRKVGQ